ncbi:zinc finger and BTB domain-containing protein 21 isoform X2 [Balaenoptera musculus]|uniref:Zinc finger and BTB domain-containing protein 21 isoform X2 n=1 Tax=Balaenoptera musculus TaxID=9771 RepID=A0A8B8XA19_BALMU|nr:zinc finger and BTB domain-containing protein 21 isoform X2 [Balaenoptera musculus]
MEGLLHYINPAHAISLLSALNEERLKGQLCDVLLIVGDQKFRAHKNVLAASSEYFQSLFTNQENESQTVFQLDFCEPDAFDNVLNYIYSSSLFVEKGSLAAVQELGYSLGISFLTNIASKTPQAPFPTCPNRKKPFAEDDENSSQKRSVIVCQSRNEAPGKTVSQNPADPSHPPRPSPGIAVQANASKAPGPNPTEPAHHVAAAEKSRPKDGPAGLAGPSEEPSRGGLAKRAAAPPSKPAQDRAAADERPGASAALPRGVAVELALRSPRPPVRVKAEPRSPPEPGDIIRVTVGDAAAATRDLVPQADDDRQDASRLPAKRRFQADRRLPAKQPKAEGRGSPDAGDPGEERSGPPLLEADFPGSGLSKAEFAELEGARPNKKFKCKHCLKIFRSTAGLHRHVNMYHNPEKPYACDICHKRFHTNFKVWTHCQTQHGIVKNPSPAASSHAVLDEKFQRKLIDIVREREIKKALILKLRRGRPGFQGPGGSPAQAIKRSLRSRAKGAHVCTACGKACRFLSQLKQHVKMHPGEKALGAGRAARPRERAAPGGPAGGGSELYLCRLCNAKLSSLLEQGSHERLCRTATVCPYCSLRFFSPELKREHEGKCEYRKLTCLECMRTFKSAFSIWRHQVEVHNQNSMAPAAGASPPRPDLNGEASGPARPQALPEAGRVDPAAAAAATTAAEDDPAGGHGPEPVNFDPEDSPCLPEDLSLSRPLKVQVKEEPAEGPEEEVPEPGAAPKDLWPCEKCGKTFPAPKQLERHQELLCSVKPFICHVCNKAFRTNFRLWSHFQSHMAQAAEDPAHREPEVGPGPTGSPSPPPLPPPLPKIQPLEPDSPTGLPENPAPSADKLFAARESDTLFYHAPPLSAITFKRQFMCKLCHRTFKTAFSLWSHEQTHS